MYSTPEIFTSNEFILTDDFINVPMFMFDVPMVLASMLIVEPDEFIFVISKSVVFKSGIVDCLLILCSPY